MIARASQRERQRDRERDERHTLRAHDGCLRKMRISQVMDRNRDPHRHYTLAHTHTHIILYQSPTPRPPFPQTPHHSFARVELFRVSLSLYTQDHAQDHHHHHHYSCFLLVFSFLVRLLKTSILRTVNIYIFTNVCVCVAIFFFFICESK